jgi:glycine C-acetyltransferase
MMHMALEHLVKQEVPSRRGARVQDDIDVYFSTFAKSMANIGAFVAADKDIIDYLKYNMRSQMFAKALPMIQTIGSLNV